MGKILIAFLCLGVSSACAMEGSSSSLSKEKEVIEFDHRWGNSLLFLGTTAIPLISMSINGSVALIGLYRIITGELSKSTFIPTAVGSVGAIVCGYVTYEYGYKHFKSEQGLFGYKRNKFKDALRKNVEITGTANYDTVRKCKDAHPEDWDELVPELVASVLILDAGEPEKLNQMRKKHKLFGYGENTFNDAFNDLLETRDSLDEADIASLRTIKMSHPEDFDRYVYYHNVIKQTLFDISPENFSNNMILHAIEENPEEVAVLVAAGTLVVAESAVDLGKKTKEAVGEMARRPHHNLKKLKKKAGKAREAVIRNESRRVIHTLHSSQKRT